MLRYLHHQKLSRPQLYLCVFVVLLIVTVGSVLLTSNSTNAAVIAFSALIQRLSDKLFVHLENTTKTPLNFTIPCKWTPDGLVRPRRVKTNINCNKQPALYTSLEETHSNSAPPGVTTLLTNETSCLRRVIREHCDVTQRVPRVAHYVRFGRFNLSLDCFISVLSVARFLQPCLIVFHSDVVPEGPYWRALLSLLPNIVRMHMDRPREIFGHSIKVVEHSSDVSRLRILLEYGGVYLDTDHLVVNPLDDLLNESAVIGIEVPRFKCGNGFLIAEHNSKFLRIWLAKYVTFSDRKWAMHSTIVPYQLSLKFPHLVHVVDSFFKPGWNRAMIMFGNRSLVKMDWRKERGVHVYSRMVRKVFEGPVRIDQQDNVMGDVVRYILFGDQHACR